ncbi:pseudouridine synthase [Phaeovulum sp. NW3]|uniref:pseudouridine synthase n=1 Tax=Phaeovulum sp. NW3 TaxID=2934933 RepID=UPI0032E385D0
MATEDKAPATDRIAKVIARSGVASRRDAEKMILAGRVAVNGKKIDSPALDVTPADRVTIDGKPIDAPQETRVWLYYKPLGLVTTEKDEQGRRTIFDEMPEGMPRVLNVGRLDLNSEGILLLTNDGGLKRRLELPETGWLRKYRVRVNGRPNDATFDPLRRGITIEGEEFQPMEITLDRQQGANAWLTVGIREGRNREVRRAMTEVGLTVNRLIRVSYGPFRLNEMKPGDVVEVKRRVLRDQLGSLLTGEEAGSRPARPPRDADGGRPRREGDRKPFARREDGDRKPFAKREDGDRKPYPRREDDDRKPFAKREDGDRKPYPRREDGDRKPFAKREDGDRKPYARREDGDRKPFAKREDGDRKPYARREDGDRKPFAKRDDGDRKPYARREDGDRKPYARREDGDRKPFAKREDGDRKPYPRREDGDRKPFAKREDGERKPRWGAAGSKPRSDGDQRPADGGDRARGPRPAGAGRSAGYKSHGAKPDAGARSSGYKSEGGARGGKPGAKPGGFRAGPKPGGPKGGRPKPGGTR